MSLVTVYANSTTSVIYVNFAGCGAPAAEQWVIDQSTITEQTLRFVKATWAALLPQYVIWGIAITVAFLCAQLLSKRKKRVDRMTILYSTILFLSCTANIALSTSQMVNSVTQELPAILGVIFSFAGDAAVPFQLDKPLFFATLFSLQLSLWVSDSFIVYRTAVIWQFRKSVLVVPCILVVISIIGGIGLQISSAWSIIESFTYYICLLTVLSISSLVDIICTTLITIRLVKARREINEVCGGHGAVHYGAIIAIFVESAAVYTIPKALLLGFNSTGSEYAPLVANAVLSPLSCLAPNLILLRTALGIDATRQMEFHQKTEVKFAGGKEAQSFSFAQRMTEVFQTTISDDNGHAETLSDTDSSI